MVRELGQFHRSSVDVGVDMSFCIENVASCRCCSSLLLFMACSWPMLLFRRDRSRSIRLIVVVVVVLLFIVVVVHGQCCCSS